MNISLKHMQETDRFGMFYTHTIQNQSEFPKYVNQSKQFLKLKAMEGKYSLRQIVWAKVDPHPWWPGRVIKILQQNKKTVYKVSFFADPTYTFLHQNQLVPYATFAETYTEIQNQPLLQKAIQLANTSNTKLNYKNERKNSKSFVSNKIFDFSIQKTEKNTSQNMIIRQEKIDFSPLEAVLTQQEYPSPVILSEITTDNVIEMIFKSRQQEKGTCYSYEGRKEDMIVQGQLKRNLLLRYNLPNYPEERQRFSEKYQRHIISSDNISSTQKTTKRICKEKIRKNLLGEQIESLRVKCLRKINSILKNSKDSSGTSKYHAICIMKRILILAQNNRTKLQSLFTTLVKVICASSPLANCEEKLAEFNSYLQQLENDKHQDEGSKITQIQVIN